MNCAVWSKAHRNKCRCEDYQCEPKFSWRKQTEKDYPPSDRSRETQEMKEVVKNSQGKVKDRTHDIYPHQKPSPFRLPL